MGLVKGYLIFYNAIQVIGWSAILVRLVQYHALETPYETAWEAFGDLLCVFQTLAVLEVVNAVLGMVKTPVMTTVIQVASRLLLTWGIAYTVPMAKDHLFLSTMVASWAITEIVRYSFYTVKETGKAVPYFLLWLRYTLFFVLYITGAGSEFLLIYVSLDAIKADRILFYDFNDSLSFNFYYACIGLMATYPLLFPKMYFHMISQRRKILGSKPAEQGKKRR
eukprot:CAMPEP_0174258874 /NCGR_PEP_ID=MMETSP0439-20130205/7793_1 /TAXON_ID=0 /ORGANISM="Stereomyxa ramosa, Strain Chinc5" /LENGTH=221 /DNA_ID=CAMNT_0015342547 /DNA_START=41 /DNA_END=706 /DNA_ORIENTATION=+